MRVHAFPVFIGLLAPASALAQQIIQLPGRDKILSDKPAVVYTVGKEDGEDWEILSGVVAAAFDLRDNLYVLDGNNFRVLVFDANGRFVRRIGRRGEGPGELIAPAGMTVMTDGTVVVSDDGRRAFSLFNSDGTFMRNVPFGDREGLGGRTGLAATGDSELEGVRMHPRGGVVAQVYPRRVPALESADTSAERKVQVKHIDLGTPAGVATVLFQFTLPSITPKVTEQTSGGALVTMQPTYWTPANTMGVLPSGGLAVSHEADYRVKVANPVGQVERILERPVDPRKGTQADKEVFLRRLRDAFAQAGGRAGRGGPPGSAGRAGAPEGIEQMLRNATWREVIPAVRRVTADPQNRIWVARTPTDFGVYGPVDLLRADGAYIGTIAHMVLPAAVSKSGRAVFIERDDVGVERVTVKRLPASWQ
jgi:hypothetical protein